jgi:hypothetical protein
MSAHKRNRPSFDKRKREAARRAILYMLELYPPDPELQKDLKDALAAIDALEKGVQEGIAARAASRKPKAWSPCKWGGCNGTVYNNRCDRCGQEQKP